MLDKTPLEMALEREGQIEYCDECEYVRVVDNTVFCSLSGKLLHPMMFLRGQGFGPARRCTKRKEAREMGLTAADLARLGPGAQRKVLQKLGAQKRPREKKTNKYHARPTDVWMPDGTVRNFASEKEAERFRELDLLQRAGQITGLRCQVPFELIPKQKRADGNWEHPCTYVADFVYRDGCKVVVEDVKGYDDSKSAAYRLFVIKRKLMLMVHGITIKEI